MEVRACSVSGVRPRLNASSTKSKRSGPPWASASSSASSPAGGSGVASSSRERSAFANACLKVRPIAIASPTDFMCVERPASEPGNFSNAKRGHLTTQ